MRINWTTVLSVGLMTLMSVRVSAFPSLIPGQSPQEAMELWQSNIVYDSSTKTYYVKQGEGLCSLRQVNFELPTAQASPPGFVTSIETLEGSCNFPPTRVLNFIHPESTVTARATVRTTTEKYSERSSSDTAYLEQLFEMVLPDRPRAVANCAVSLSVQLPTGRRLSVTDSFYGSISTSGERSSCEGRFDHIIIPRRS
ncbi:hypothetical protein HJG54_12905 [Leptolyngbya sp. NK1-12]|uniref:Uncharacterized protein n=1 Tax=Leptolyngbya sp. NK1-12 TaxID=2547451 RepID=A0AA96WEN0_9CYAN|nr:hypothetical protein [Leptolyngbya sp. NK1-12]WNZ23665.1 hypothetical protein HJG54_12905 [Leptolyngbya sp. NK1-12]